MAERKPQAGTSRRRVLSLAAAIYVCLRLLAVAGQEPVLYPDTASYLGTASTLPAWFVGEPYRLPVVPAFYDLFSSNELRVIAQTGVGALAWLGLAYVLWMSRRSKESGLSAGLVLALGLSSGVTQWDRMILSESLSISIGVAAIAVGFRFGTRPSRHSAFALVLVVALWLLCRPANVAAVPVLLVAVACWSVRYQRVQLGIAMGAGVLAAGLFAAGLAGQDDFIWRYNSSSIAAVRVLPDAEEAAHFESKGMPITADMRATTGSDFQGVTAQPYMGEGPFMAWAESEWRATYTNWLLARPDRAILDPLGSWESLVHVSMWAPRILVLPPAVDDIVYGASRVGDLAWLMVAAVALVVAVRARVWMALTCCTAAGAIWITSWHLAALEHDRLFAPPSIWMRVGIIAALGALNLRHRTHEARRHHRISMSVTAEAESHDPDLRRIRARAPEISQDTNNHRHEHGHSSPR